MTADPNAEPQFRIIQSNQLNSLADCLIEDFATSAKQRHPLAPCTLVVPSLGMQKWLSYQLAKSLDIAASVDYVLPASLIWRIVNLLLPEQAKAESLYTKERMHLALYKLLSDTDAAWLSGELAPKVRAFLGINQAPPEEAKMRDDVLLKRYRFAGWAADLFDQYLIYRPDWMMHWRGVESQSPDDTISKASTSQPWQPLLWKELVKAMDQAPDRAMLQQQALLRLTSGEVPYDLIKDALGTHLTLFGISALPPAQLAFFAALSHHLQIDFYLSNPCRQLWTDIVSPKHRSTIAAKSHGSDTQVDISDYYSIGHPLLGSLGRSGRDFIDQLFVLNDNFDPTDAFVEPCGTDLLHRLQGDILDLNLPTAAEGTRLDPKDQSIRMASCYGPMREVEALHDWIIHCLHLQPELTPEDVVVMVPNIDTYRPYIEAVFGLNSGTPTVPYSISDHQREAGADVVDALKMLLKLPESRLGASEIDALLEVPAIQRAFNLKATDVARIIGLIEESGVRWGADKEHWHAVGAQPVALELDYPYSWAYGLERIMLSYCLGEINTEFAGIEPFAGPISPTDPAAVGLFRLIKQLLHYKDELSKPHSAKEWAPILHRLPADFFELADTETFALNRYHSETSRLGSLATELGLDETLPLSLVCEMLNLDADIFSNQHRYLIGGVTFCTLMPMRNIPFKIVALIGMNEGDFPRSPTKLSFDLMETYHRKGDRDIRSESFYMFLEAVLSARDRLYISWCGLDARNNQTLPPSVMLTLLQNTLKRCYGDPTPLLIQHPLQPFSGKYGQEEPWFTYAAHWVLTDAKEQDASVHTTDLPSQQTASSPDTNNVHALKDLLNFYAEPARAYLQQQHHLYQPPKPTILTDEEPIDLDGLGSYKLVNAGIELMFEPDGIALWRKKAEKDQNVPQGVLGNMILAELEGRLTGYQKFVLGENGETPTKINIDLKCSGFRILGELDGILPKQRVELLAGTASAKHWLPFWINHLVLCAVGNDVPSLLKDKVKTLVLQAVPEAEALEMLADYLDVRQLYLNADVGTQPPLLIASSYAWSSNFHKFGANETSEIGDQWHMDEAKQAWEDGGYNNYGAEGRLWYNQILWTKFPGDTHPDEFALMAKRIWSKFFVASKKSKK